MITVGTYNVYLGADLSTIFGVQDADDLLRRTGLVHDQLVRTDFPSRARAIAALVARERIDVLGLQEVVRWTRVSGKGASTHEDVWCDFRAELLDALEKQGTPYDAHAVNVNFQGGAVVTAGETMNVVGSNVILVRRDPAMTVDGSATGGFSASLDITTGLDDFALNIPRGWCWVDVTTQGRRLRFVNTHTEAYSARVRAAQRDELLTAIGDPGLPVVLVGDFNAPPGSVGMPAPYVDAWLAAGGDRDGGFTCGQAPDLANARSALRSRIDYVWVRGPEVRWCRLIGDSAVDRTVDGSLWPSDHAGVVAGLTF